ncbi:MAG TPA: pitrilysin family protein [Nitrososphaerales archaeon]|nr:pitrilysin family protein [Nitrososphaerales archaeon]
MDEKRFKNLELKREVFENGFVLLSNKISDSETVAISGSMKSGAICDEKGRFGIAELVSRLLMRGTKQHTGSEISQKIEESGATLSFDNRDESVYFSSRCYIGVLDDVLEILGECLMQPSFPEIEIALSRNEILSEIKAQSDDTRTSAYRRLFELIFGSDEPYGRDSLGIPDDLNRLTREDLVRFHEENYFSDRAVFAITGGYDYDRVREKLDKIFSSWNGKNSSRKITYRETARSDPKVSAVNLKHKSQVDLAIGTRAVPRSSQYYYSLNLGNLILGRLGLYGRLGKNVREERGLAYYSFSALQAKLYSGFFGVFAGVNPVNLEKAVEGITEELTKITTQSISEKELETAKRNSIGSLSISLDTSSERVGIIHEIEYYNLGLDYLERYPGILERISGEEILHSFKKFISLDKMSMVASGPVESRNLRLPGARIGG